MALSLWKLFLYFKQEQWGTTGQQPPTPPTPQLSLYIDIIY
jgi:hypothetical protein